MSERPTLRLDAQGEHVGRLHEQLAVLGYAVDPAESAMRLFGAATRRLVVSVQKERGLAPTGVVDSDTAAAIEAGAVGAPAASMSPEPAGAAEPIPAVEPAAADTIPDRPRAPTSGRASSLRSGGPTTEALLETLPPELALSRTQREALVGAIEAGAPPGPSLPGGVAGLSVPQEAAVRSALALARVVGGDSDLMRVLQRRLPSEPDGTLKYLTTMSANDWIATVAIADPSMSMSGVEVVAAGLAAAVDREHPSLAFQARLRGGTVDVDGYPTVKVADFLAAHPDFDIASTPVEPFLIDRHLQADTELATGVRAVQRVLELGSTQAEAIGFLRARLTSATAVVSAGREALTGVAAGWLDESRADAVFSAATLQVSAMLGVASTVVPAVVGPRIPALGGGPASLETAESGPVRDLLARFPSLGAIFGDQSARACTHCGSVLGPAAYLVDLLNSLSRAGVEPELRARRPDIALLELTCANTNTELPYVDLVLEILENAVCFPIYDIALTPAEHDQLDAGSVPDSVRARLALTVNRLDGQVTAVKPTESTSEELWTFVAGHRRWSAWRSREAIEYGRAGEPGRVDVPQELVDVARDALRRGRVPPELLALFAPEPRLPVEGTPTVEAVKGAAGTDEQYHVGVGRQVAAHLSWSGGGGGAVTLEHVSGDLIVTDLIRDGADLVAGLAGELAAGRVPQYVANLLPARTFEVTPDPANPRRWILSAADVFTVRYLSGGMVITGLAFTGSTPGSDLTAFPENRNPCAYTVLAGARYPWSLPFDVFTEEVRACLMTLGVSRLELTRALRPVLRNSSVLDACEILDTCAGQLAQLTPQNPPGGPSGFWGLNDLNDPTTVVEPSGDPGAPPLPADWVGVLSRLSVLLHRSGVTLPILLGALASRYVGGGVAPTLEPATEDRPSRITVAGLTEAVLSRLHRFLRLRRITGWPVRDLDLALAAATTGVTPPESTGGQPTSTADINDSTVQALAGLHELAGRLDVPLHQAAAWAGAVETRGFTDYEQVGTPILPSYYALDFLQNGAAGTDFDLDPDGAELAYITAQRDPKSRVRVVLKPISGKAGKTAEICRALHIKPTDVATLLATPDPPIADTLTLDSLAALARHVAFARALSLSVADYRRLLSVAGEDVFPNPATTAPDERVRRLMRFCDLVEALRSAGTTVDQLAEVVGMAPTDPAAQRRADLGLMQDLAALQAALRVATSPAAAVPDAPEIRALLTAAGWPPAAIERVITGGPSGIGLSSTQVTVTITRAGPPALPIGSPFTVAPGPVSGEYLLGAVLQALAAGGAQARFADLAAVPGLGPLADPESPAGRLKAAWQALDPQISRLGMWLQSLDLPVTRLAYTFTGLVPAELVDAGARLRYDASSKELLLIGYLDPAEPTAMAARVGDPAFAAAINTLAAEADSYKEGRSGSLLLPATATRDLISREPSLQTRYAAVYQALQIPVRRRLLARSAAQLVGVDLSLFTALDDAAQLGSPPTDVLAPLCSAEFAAANLHEAADLPDPPLSDWLAAVTELRRVGALLTALRVQPTELAWFDEVHGFTGLSQLGFSQAGSKPPVATFQAWRSAVTLYRLRDRLPGGAATLEAIRTATSATGALDSALAILEWLFQLPGGSTIALRLDGLLTKPAELRDPILLDRVVHAAQTLRRLGATSEVASSLCQLQQSETTAAAARGLFAGKYAPDDASAGLRAAVNALRERQRTCLVDFLVQRDHARDPADLHARYLLDVQMGAEMRTSRIKQAISSTQLFIQRWLMNLESADLPSASSEFAKAWEWTRSYRVWEANRNVFLFAQDWLEPSLRDDKSHLFTALESSLLQSEVTSERGVEALARYLDGLDEISRLTVVAMYRETRGPRTNTVHMVGRSAYHPVKYYYRQWRPVGAAGSWDPWEPLEVVGDTDHLVVFVRNGRPHLAWLQIDTAQTTDTTDMDADGAAAPMSPGPAPAEAPPWAAQLAWSRRDQNGWAAPRRSANKIAHPKAIGKDARTTFALRLDTTDPRGPVVRGYGGSARDPVRWPAEDVSTSEQPSTHKLASVSVQVLGKTSDGRYFGLEDALVDVTGTAPAYVISTNPRTGAVKYGPPFDDGPQRLTNIGGLCHKDYSLPWQYQNTSLEIAVRVTLDGASQTAVKDVPLTFRHDVRLGFVFDINEPSTSPTVAKRFETRLRLYPLAAGSWVSSAGLRWRPVDSWDAARELPWVGKAEHFCSGYRFPAGAPVRIFDTTLGAPSPPTDSGRVFVAAAATQESSELGWPVYVAAEATAWSGFITAAEAGELTWLPATEVTHFAVQRALDAVSDTPRLTAGPADGADQELGLALAAGIKTPFPAADPQFDRALPYAGYDWEIFFHAPMMIAHGLATHQRYGEALRWLHTVFDPTASDGTGQRQWWRFPPFAAAGAGSEIDLLMADFSAGRLDPKQQALFQAQVDFSRGSPFRPHAIARMRPRAYQWMVVLKYLDVLIAWGDQQFRRDTIESINEATQLYLLAADLLGRRPTQLPPRPPSGGPPTFTGLMASGHPDDWMPLTDTPFFKQLVAWLTSLVQHGMGPGTSTFDTAAAQLRVLVSTQSLTFCVPRNERLDRYWDLVEDRLLKIRSSQNIDGVARRLALFEPPIDPALLIQAVAAGLDITSVLNEMFAPQTPYRFTVAVALAEELCAEVRSFGAALLATLEKRDAEQLARLRSTQEVSLLQLVGEFKQRQHDEAKANLTALRQSRTSAEVRFRHYQLLLGKTTVPTPAEDAPVTPEPSRLQLGAATSDRVDPDLRGYGLTLEEADHLGWLTVGNTYTLIGGAFQTAAGIAHMFPNLTVGPPMSTATFGGDNVGSALGAVGQFFSLLAGNASFQASRSSIIAGHQRRYDDWVLQSNSAGKEIEAIDKQILAAQIRVDLAGKEIGQHQRQEENAKSVDEFMREKFTATELYEWMADRLGEAHGAAYQLAYEMARRAQRCFAFELGGAQPTIVAGGAWDESHRGLLAGERLSLDLKRLKTEYADRNRRELEVTKHVSLAALDPLALLTLQTTGSCEFAIPEIAYDLDFPGHYMRRIRTVSVSLPCVVGPYSSVAGTLTLLENSLRASASRPKGTDSADYRRDLVSVQSVAISAASADPGVFELNFRDERYLPFEGAGAISRWRLELPAQFRSFDYGSISDLVLHVRYTARAGGDALKAAANTRVRAALEARDAQLAGAGEEGMLVRAVSLRHEFPTQWARLHDSTAGPQGVQIGTGRFPFLVHDRKITIWKVGLYVRGPAVTPDADPPLAAAYTGDDPQPPIPWGAPTVRADGAALYEFDLEHDPRPASSRTEAWPWAPLMVSNSTPMSWTVTTAPPGKAGVSEAVLAFWWRLASSPSGRP